MLSSLPRSRPRDADDDGRAEIAPTPFLACLIKSTGGLSVDEQKEVLPPSVNDSEIDFAVAEGKIKFGLSAIKGCGGSAGEAIVSARTSGGPLPTVE